MQPGRAGLQCQNEKQLREAAKTFEHVVEAFGLIAVMSFMDVIGHKLKKERVEEEIKADTAVKKVKVEDIIGKKANDLIEVLEEYVLVHFIDNDGILQTNIRRKNATIGEFLFVDENNYIRNVKDVKQWNRENTVGSTPVKIQKLGRL